MKNRFNDVYKTKNSNKQLPHKSDYQLQQANDLPETGGDT
jgi:hypothetical protein